MDDYRVRELRRIAEGQIERRGKCGKRTIRELYGEMYELTEDEVQYIADLIWRSQIVLPD